MHSIAQHWMLVAHHYLLRWLCPYCGRLVWADSCLPVSVSLRADMFDISVISASQI